MKLEGGTKPFALFPLCAVLFFCFCSCDPIAAENGLELEGEAKLAGIEETDVVWSEDENVEDIGKLAEHTDEYETTQDERNGLEDRERRQFRRYCRGRPYNPSFYLCCNGYLARKTGLRPACCGRYSYDATFYMCCAGNRVRKTGLRPACCGRYGYDATFYLCCAGRRARKTGLRPACCGRVSYDATFYLCCWGRLKRKVGSRPSC